MYERANIGSIPPVVPASIAPEPTGGIVRRQAFRSPYFQIFSRTSSLIP